MVAKSIERKKRKRIAIAHLKLKALCGINIKYNQIKVFEFGLCTGEKSEDKQ